MKKLLEQETTEVTEKGRKISVSSAATDYERRGDKNVVWVAVPLKPRRQTPELGTKRAIPGMITKQPKSRTTTRLQLTVAVALIGMVLAAILFIKRSSETTQIMAVDETVETEGSQHSLVGKVVQMTPSPLVPSPELTFFQYELDYPLELSVREARQR